MNSNFEIIAAAIREVRKQYDLVITGNKFDYNNIIKSRELLRPIILPLMMQAESRIKLCDKEIETNNKKQEDTLDKRSALYRERDSQRNQLSSLDTRRIGITENISRLSREIQNDEEKIRAHQEEIARQEKAARDWETAFWATCWIPFANIGVGVKKITVDNELYAKVKTLGDDIQYKENRIKKLNSDLAEANREQKRNKESSSKLANQITSIEGEIASVTNLVNDLKREAGLWQTILFACQEIEAKLLNADTKIELVIECFEELLKVEELLIVPMTNKFIAGKVCKGDRLLVGQTLNQNEYLMSENKRFVAVMQADNNFVVYNSEGAIWSSQTQGTQGKGSILLNTRGLAVYSGIQRIWDTKRIGAVAMIMQNDGNLVNYDINNKPVWASDTYTYANVSSIFFNPIFRSMV